MSSRYATIITDDDGREVVSSIGEFEGGAPDVRVGRVERVPPGVLIGMVRAVDAAGTFGFPAGSPGANGRAVGIAAANPNARPCRQAAALPVSSGGASGPGKPAMAKPAMAAEAKPGRAPKPPAKPKAARRVKAARSTGHG